MKIKLSKSNFPISFENVYLLSLRSDFNQSFVSGPVCGSKLAGNQINVNGRFMRRDRSEELVLPWIY